MQSFFGITLILYLLKLSAGKGFWKNLRNSDETSHKIAVIYERVSKKLQAAEYALKFLIQCRDEDISPKFTRWKNLRKLSVSKKKKRCKKILFDEINNKHKLIKQLKRKKVEAEENLKHVTWLKRNVVKHIVDNYLKREENSIKKRHEKKIQSLRREKRLNDGTRPNPNKIIINLTNTELTNDQYSALQYGLKYGIATQPKDSDLIASAESVWEQINSHGWLKNSFFKVERAKNSLRAFVFNILDFDNARIRTDNKKIQSIKDILENNVILKPDKGEGVVIISRADYKSSMETLFSDRKRFQVIKEDLTPARLSSVQRYLRTLCNRGEIDEATYLFMRPQAAKPARTHGLPKIHKLFDKIPKFRPIIDTTGTTHYGIGKYLSQLLQPLTINEYTIKDTFDAKARIKTIDEAHLQQGYKYVSFDVVSLFTNVPLERTLKVIERRIYDEEELATTLKRCTLRKLVRDTCKKTIFSCNDVYYEQIDGVSMGGSLGPVLANIILTEFERIVINPLLSSGVIKFYCRYVDDTLLLIKHDDIDMLLNKFHSFDSNIRFTYDTFSDEPPHFLDLNLDDNKFSIYRKRTFTGQYTHFDSFVPWKYRIAWIRSLLSRIHKICSPSKLAQELQFLKKIASWNGYPKQVVYSLIKRFDQHLYKSTDNENNNNMTDANAVVPTLWLEMPYIGMKGEQLLHGLKRKLLRCLNINVQIRTRITTTKLNMYTNTKDKVPKQNKSNIVYEFTCPKCNESYIGKTDRTLLERVREHAYKDDESAVNKHLHSCYDTTDLNSKSNKELTELVLTNTYIIDHSNNWNLLLYKEALHIRRRKPLLNNGLKASRELQLFN